jgi:hypothetical protein
MLGASTRSRVEPGTPSSEIKSGLGNTVSDVVKLPRTTTLGSTWDCRDELRDGAPITVV